MNHSVKSGVPLKLHFGGHGLHLGSTLNMPSVTVVTDDRDVICAYSVCRCNVSVNLVLSLSVNSKNFIPSTL